MIFTSGAFLAFYLIVFCVYWLLKGRTAQNAFLLLASQFFYGWWDWRFLGLMWVCILICHIAALLVERGTRPHAVTATAITLLLGILAVFKYFNFFTDSLVSLGHAVGLDFSVGTLEVILPVGISFFVFEAICYVIDVKRRDIHADPSLMHTALYISFFPKMMAGPIIRPSNFFPQVQQPRRFTGEDFAVGIKLFLIGFIYKAVFSDSISPYVDEVYGSLAKYDRATVVMATLGFYAQIYFDFCGYSLMAIGVARTLGFHLPRNFNFPYIATNITDFWRRWHISLSTWLRDYLYISLGGNRGGEIKRQRNLMLTMLLGGLWHGASWNFVVWGGLHGTALVVHKQFAALRARLIDHGIPLLLWGVAAWVITQFFVLLTWIPFRAQGFDGTLRVLSAFAGGDVGSTRADIPYVMIIVPLIIDTLVVGLSSKWRIGQRLPRLSPAWSVVVLAMVMVAGAMVMPLQITNFIYFQF